MQWQKTHPLTPSAKGGGDFRLPQPRKLESHADFSFCHCEHYFFAF
ncbi:hypothetical protein [Helicobacter sp. T3_23-1056]